MSEEVSSYATIYTWGYWGMLRCLSLGLSLATFDCIVTVPESGGHNLVVTVSPSPSSSQFVFKSLITNFQYLRVKIPPLAVTSAESNCEILTLFELKNKYHLSALWEGNHIKYISYIFNIILLHTNVVSLFRVKVIHFFLCRSSVINMKYFRIYILLSV